MPEIKIATFNVENLFRRAKVFNFYDHNDGDEKLKIIAELQNEFKKSHYDKPKIIELYKKVKDYIKFNVVRSSVGYLIVYKRHGQYYVAPNGREDWFGFIEFKREKFSDDSTKNTAKIIRDTNADILCMIEVEDRIVLKQFNSDRLNRMYEYNMLIDGNDNRGIDVGIYSKLDFGMIKTNIYETENNSPIFSRDCLEVEIKIDNNISIFFLINHFKSKSGSNQVDNDARRLRQAQKVKNILDNEYDLDNQYVVVAGDFNDTPDSAPLNPLMSHTKLHDVLAEKFPNHDDRWTYYYRSKEQIDYILVSNNLINKFKDAGVDRRGIANIDKITNGQEQPLSPDMTWRDAASDHGAVWAKFTL